ncbi:MAG: methionyl-tRNA formyltransferase [Oceanospirillaceae bacterium]|nr:methionyl-tRNA formyltransferase [Thalassolituus sp.]MAS25815.1 methionyl-tRNA formyltransferase [Oceanospirillaceae bacterium]MAX98551.1 methionyl-tRNA formyltransferase [Oceanospirillaceae bacterium]MBL35452.1 methionyl-tRNA formyltransferase [Oceanospirillaceae bacterium]MBS51865.1 methionyl-tRNA formyltransferase [Oceanospirillaceae bacterium]
MRILFAGTPDFAAAHLRALIASEHDIIGVYSQPDRPAGRGKKLQPSPVKQVALEHDIPVYQPLNFKDPAAVEELAALNADVMIVVAYGLILPQSVLDAPKYGCLNVHASILPRWRGAAPIQRCIEAGDMVTGITIMQMDKGLDTGDMLSKVTTGISADETGGSLHDRLAEMGPPALLDTLAKLEAGELKPEIQNDMLACYAHKLSKEEALLDWNLSASELDRKVRAFNPFPMAYTLLGDNRIRVFQAEMLEKVTDMLPGTIVNVSPKGIEVACSENVLRISTVQLPGKKAMSVADVINGQPQLFQVNHMLASQH